MNLRSISTLQWALGISVAIHAVLLTVRFVDPEGFNRVFEDTPLEVILVNAKTNEKTDKAKAIAQASLAGGGDAEKGRATSPLPSSELSEIGDSQELSSARKLQNLQEQQNLTAAQTNEIQSLVNYTKALVDFDRAIGRTLKRNNIEIDKDQKIAGIIRGQ